MSMELFVILAASQAPDVAAWNSALSAARVPASLDEHVTLSKHTGFLPATVNGKATGFYFLRESYQELSSRNPKIAQLRVSNPIVYSLGFGGDPRECAAVFYSATVLVTNFGGNAFDPQEDALMNANELLAVAKECDGSTAKKAK